MNKHIIDIETEASEVSRGEDIPAMAKPTRPGRAAVLSVRLGCEEMAVLEQLAAQRGIGTSTMARALILEGLTPSESIRVHDEIVRALRETLRPDILTHA